MNGAKRCLDAQHYDQPLDLPPTAIMQMIAHIAARSRPVRRFRSRLLSEPVDQRLGFNDIAAFDIEGQIHKALLSAVSGGRQARVIGLPAPAIIPPLPLVYVKAIG